MATIRKRGDRWQVQIRRMGYPPVSKSFLTKSAEKWGREKERAVDRAELPVNTHDLQSATVGDLLKRYRETVTAAKRGQKVEAYRIGAMLKSRLAGVSLLKLSPSVIAEYRDARLKDVSACSVLKELAILQHCFSLAIKEWGLPIQSNPVGMITKPKQNKARDRRLKRGEVEALGAALKQARNPLALAVFLFALATGMRRGEILGLKWKDIDLESRTAFLQLTKNGNSRTVPLSPAALEILTELPHREGNVFPISADALRYSFSKAVRMTGAKNLHLHDSRHEAISRFFEFGLDIMEVSAISGHKDPRMLARYTHLRPTDIAKKLAGSG
jgi:integrase